MRIFLSGISVLALCAIHLFFPNIERMLSKYKHIWIPMTGGMAIGYVFLFMMPKLSDDTFRIISNAHDEWEFLHYRLYFIAMIGFLIYFRLDMWSASDKPGFIYWKQVHGVYFCLYSLLIGYLLFNIPRSGILSIFIASLAFGTHLMGLDYGLYKLHSIDYQRILKWLLAISLITGWIVGLITKMPETFKASSSAFIAGGVLINAIMKKLPDRKGGHFVPFIAGVGFFVVIIIVMRSIPRL